MRWDAEEDCSKGEVQSGGFEEAEIHAELIESENNVHKFREVGDGIRQPGLYMGAVDSHLEKLDKIQESVSKSCGFEIESLQSRREAAAISMACKMLDGKARGDLNPFTPQFGETIALAKKSTRRDFEGGSQMKSLIRSSSLDQFKNSFLGQIPKIWKKLPSEMREQGHKTTFMKIKKDAKLFLTGKLTTMEFKQKMYRKETQAVTKLGLQFTRK